MRAGRRKVAKLPGDRDVVVAHPADVPVGVGLDGLLLARRRAVDAVAGAGGTDGQIDDHGADALRVLERIRRAVAAGERRTRVGRGERAVVEGLGRSGDGELAGEAVGRGRVGLDAVGPERPGPVIETLAGLGPVRAAVAVLDVARGALEARGVAEAAGVHAVDEPVGVVVEAVGAVAVDVTLGGDARADHADRAVRAVPAGTTAAVLAALEVVALGEALDARRVVDAVLVFAVHEAVGVVVPPVVAVDLVLVAVVAGESFVVTGLALPGGLAREGRVAPEIVSAGKTHALLEAGQVIVAVGVRLAGAGVAPGRHADVPAVLVGHAAALDEVARAVALRADVARRAGVAVVADGRVVRELAAGDGITGVVRADVLVVAGQRGTGAHPAGAGVGLGADVAVVAGGRVVDVDTTEQRARGVVGAEVAVVAVDRRTRAVALRADVVLGGEIAVVAGARVVDGDATLGRVAGVVRADVAVVAGQRFTARARAVGADVTRGAGVAVVAGARVVGGDATLGRVAGVVRAEVAVVADHVIGAHAGAERADVARGAGAAVVADVAVERTDAADTGIAGLVRAEVAVVAAEDLAPAHALVAADVVHRARAVVVAGRADRLGLVDALHLLARKRRVHRLAEVVRAGVAVLALVIVETLVAGRLHVGSQQLRALPLDGGVVALAGGQEREQRERGDGQVRETSHTWILRGSVSWGYLAPSFFLVLKLGFSQSSSFPLCSYKLWLLTWESSSGRTPNFWGMIWTSIN
jgi:hypothetical protein